MQCPEIPQLHGKLGYFRGPYVLTTSWALRLPLLDSEQILLSIKAQVYTHRECNVSHTLCTLQLKKDFEVEMFCTLYTKHKMCMCMVENLHVDMWI